MGKKCCDINGGCKPKIIKTPRNKLERWLDRHNHLMELLRTLLGIATVSLQLIIIHHLFNK
tara:strand:- start:382 stop:564 length:183 start_codon:yes stop_codon:yes gene_type:complete